MIALAAILRGRRQRGALAMRLTRPSLAASARAHCRLWRVRSGLQPSIAVRAVLYIPLLGAGLALAVLMGCSPRAFWRGAPAA